LEINRRLYFLHIPKTGGISVTSQIRNTLNKNSIPAYPPSSPPHDDIFNNYVYIQAHLANYPLDKTSNLDVATLLRNPVDRSISNFLFMYKNNSSFVERYSTIDSMINKLRFYLFEDEEYSYHRNIQSKFICGSPENNYYKDNSFTLESLVNKRSKNWFLENNTPSLQQSLDKINSFTIVGTTEKINLFTSKVSDWFLNNYGLPIPFDNNLIVNYSSILYDGIEYNTQTLKDMLGDLDIEKVLENNLIDFELHDHLYNRE